MEIGIGIIFGVVIGGIIAWVIASQRYQSRSAALEGRASSAEAIADERDRHAQQKHGEIIRLRCELAQEQKGRVEALTRLEASEKHLKEEIERFDAIRNELSETFKALSLDALTKNTDEFKKYADEFIKLAEEKLKTQATEGKKELECKKELIDQYIEAIEKTLSEVQKLIEEVGKSSG